MPVYPGALNVPLVFRDLVAGVVGVRGRPGEGRAGGFGLGEEVPLEKGREAQCTESVNVPLAFPRPCSPWEG